MWLQRIYQTWALKTQDIRYKKPVSIPVTGMDLASSRMHADRGRRTAFCDEPPEPVSQRREINILIKWCMGGKANEVSGGTFFVVDGRPQVFRPKCQPGRWCRAKGVASCQTQHRHRRTRDSHGKRWATSSYVEKYLKNVNHIAALLTFMNQTKPEQRSSRVESDVLQLNTWERERARKKWRRVQKKNKIIYLIKSHIEVVFGSGRCKVFSFILLSFEFLRVPFKLNLDLHGAIRVLRVDDKSKTKRLYLIVFCSKDH